jgi:CheY-like chemotaxis protein
MNLPGICRPDRQKRSVPSVLFVESDLRKVEKLRAALPWQLTAKKNGVAAVHYMMQNGLPDVLVTELDFPTMSGLELIRWVRAAQASAHIPIIVHAASLDPRMEQQCRAAGADEFVPQSAGPDTWKDLLQSVHEGIGKTKV